MKVDDDSSSPLPSLAVSPTMLSKIRSLHNPNIAIAGNIAVGKSTLAAALSAALGLPLYKEEVSGNPVLPLFYADMKAHSFVLQIHLLNKRFEQERLISCSGKGGIQDRTIYEDHIFAKALHDAGLMTTLEYNTYLMTAENMFKGMDRPNLIIFLWAPPEVCFDRKELRCNQNPGREMEKQTVTLEYLTTLDAGYEDFMGDLSKIIPVLKVDWSEFQIVDVVVKSVIDFYNQEDNFSLLSAKPTTSREHRTQEPEERRTVNVLPRDGRVVDYRSGGLITSFNHRQQPYYLPK